MISPMRSGSGRGGQGVEAGKGVVVQRPAVLVVRAVARRTRPRPRRRWRTPCRTARRTNGPGPALPDEVELAGEVAVVVLALRARASARSRRPHRRRRRSRRRGWPRWAASPRSTASRCANSVSSRSNKATPDAGAAPAAVTAATRLSGRGRRRAAARRANSSGCEPSRAGTSAGRDAGVAEPRRAGDPRRGDVADQGLPENPHCSGAGPGSTKTHSQTASSASTMKPWPRCSAPIQNPTSPRVRQPIMPSSDPSSERMAEGALAAGAPSAARTRRRSSRRRPVRTARESSGPARTAGPGSTA